ncbi:Uncharacterised protein [Candidatus Venteria ishoeyi]|uniref:Spore Coat Protein U domain protein n=2 Tax=Candidatus Venteria ishoeyi TaxID=1899563 RepID=A0A1H6FFD4_9GAMM|nr:Uncharacterised protein [Candidatus Venteria ishoeyi]
MKALKRLLTSSVAIALMSNINIAFAANDAALAVGSSQGDVTVSIDKGDTVAITGLTDITFAAWTAGDGNVRRDINFCSHSSTSAYQITAAGGNAAPSGDFYMEGGTGTSLEYSVYWADAVAPATDQLLDNTPLITQAGAVAVDCGGVNNSTLEVRVNAAGGFGLTNANVGSYTDLLTLTIEPE